MTDVLVSIILPAFNRERYIGGAIQSVIDQTVAAWELIVVDDGSSDGTLARVEEYVMRQPDRIRVIAQQNRGVSAARNAGIRASRGTHIAFIDSDDAWHPSKLERQLAVWRQDPSVSFVYSGYELVDASGNPWRTVRPDPRFQGDISRRLWTEENEILGPTLLIARDKLFAAGLYDDRLRGAENLDLRLKLAKLGPVRFVDATLYSYRKHGDSLTADTAAMQDYTMAMIASHFSGELSHDERRLHRQVLSAYACREGNALFEQMAYRRALRAYRRAWPGSHRKRELLVRAVRCLIGRRGNSMLRAIKVNLQGSRAGATC